MFGSDVVHEPIVRVPGTTNEEVVVQGDELAQTAVWACEWSTWEQHLRKSSED